MERLTLLYDGRCNLCIRTVETLRRLELRAELNPVALQEAAEELLPPGRSREDLTAELHVIDGSGAVYRGTDAVVRVLREVRGLSGIAMLYRMPGMKPLANRLYRLIAKHRYRLFCTSDGCQDGACSIHGRSASPEEQRQER